MDTATAAAFFAGAGLLWSIIWSIISTNRLNKIQEDVTRNNRLHDQSVQRLYRAREAVITRNKALTYLHKKYKEFDYDKYANKLADFSAAQAELKGISIAINDTKLIELMGELKSNENRTLVTIQKNSQDLHTRITELLEIATHL